MPAVVVKKGSVWKVLSHRGGKVLGTHKSLSKARAQQRAVNASLSKAGKL